MSGEAAERRRAERRLLSALRRGARSGGSVRTDALLHLVRATEAADRRPASHRGAAPLALDDAGLHAVLDALVERGIVLRDGRRLRLAETDAALDAVMAERVERLLADLRAAGASPPRVEGIARRLGVPPHVVDQLRRSGSLVPIAPGIDYPRDVWDDIRRRIGPGSSPARIRTELGVSRRAAAAIVAARAQSRC